MATDRASLSKVVSDQIRGQILAGNRDKQTEQSDGVSALHAGMVSINEPRVQEAKIGRAHV